MQVQWAGPILGIVTVLTIAAGHVLVRRLHARFGTAPAAPLFALSGLGLLASLLARSDLLSGVLGITAITIVWDGIELYRQEKRVRRLKSEEAGE
jgi:hypothetical protein